MISIIKINNINYKGNCSPIHGPITNREGGFFQILTYGLLERGA